VYRLIEVRVGRPISGDEYLGLAQQFPRLAVFFIVSGLALVGLPGTLGFCADELLLHGALESHPQLGLALPLATALNAFHIFRLYSRLFLGSRGMALPGVPDARPVERWVLTFGLLFLIGGGLFPSAVVGLRADAAETISTTANAANDRLTDLFH
jgi:NADH-quinone oxidoreductase subunit M